MDRLPQGGWGAVPPDVEKALGDFNNRYTTLLTQLQDAWSGANESPTLDTAIATMRSLKKPVRD